MKIFFVICLIGIVHISSIRLKKAETEVIESTAFALGKVNTDQFYLSNSDKYRSVPYVDQLPPQTPIGDGKVEDVEVVESDINYYDGTLGFKTTITTVCGDYTTQPQVCVNQGSCGWCGSSNSCINGNNLGPLSPCIKGTYVFNAPDPSWNPLPNSKVTNLQVGAGAVLTKIEEVNNQDKKLEQNQQKVDIPTKVVQIPNA